MATTDEADVLMPQLLDRGWGVLRRSAVACASWAASGRVNRLQLVVDDQALLDDLNPYAPDGWWAAVDGLIGRCVVVVIYWIKGLAALGQRRVSSLRLRAAPRIELRSNGECIVRTSPLRVSPSTVAAASGDQAKSQ